MVCRCAPVGAGTCAQPTPDARARRAVAPRCNAPAGERPPSCCAAWAAASRAASKPSEGLKPAPPPRALVRPPPVDVEILVRDFVRIEISERSPRLVTYLYLGMLVVDPMTLLSAPQVLGGAGVMECMPKCRRDRRVAVPYNCRCCSLLALGASASCIDRQASDYCRQRQGCHPAAMCV